MAEEVAVVARRGERPRSETVLADQNPQAMTNPHSPWRLLTERSFAKLLRCEKVSFTAKRSAQLTLSTR